MTTDTTTTYSYQVPEDGLWKTLVTGLTPEEVETARSELSFYPGTVEEKHYRFREEG